MSTSVSAGRSKPEMMNRSAGCVAAALLLSLLLSACSDREPSSPAEPSTRSSPSGDPTPAPAGKSRCPNEIKAVEAGQRVGGEASGDVDGDGSDDLVYLVTDEAGVPGCRIFLAAETGRGILSTPAGEPDVSYALPAPRINSLVQVDGSGGLEILVDLEQGASTQFLGMFKVTPSGLDKVRIAGGSPYGDLFPYGGSVGHIEASNCTDEGDADVLVAIATPNATGYTIRTVLYEMKGAVLKPLSRNEQPPVATGADVELSEGFDSSPFGDCPTSS